MSKIQQGGHTITGYIVIGTGMVSPNTGEPKTERHEFPTGDRGQNALAKAAAILPYAKNVEVFAELDGAPPSMMALMTNLYAVACEGDLAAPDLAA